MAWLLLLLFEVPDQFLGRNPDSIEILKKHCYGLQWHHDFTPRAQASTSQATFLSLTNLLPSCVKICSCFPLLFIPHRPPVFQLLLLLLFWRKRHVWHLLRRAFQMKSSASVSIQNYLVLNLCIYIFIYICSWNFKINVKLTIFILFKWHNLKFAQLRDFF